MGIVGYILLYNFFGMQFVVYQKFNLKEDVLCNGMDVLFIKRLVDKELVWKLVREINIGEKLLQKIFNLMDLLEYCLMK